MPEHGQSESLMFKPPAAGTGGPELDWHESIHSFQDDIHGCIQLNSLERDVVDTPEFQRLFRIGQLGFVDLLFPTANHTRGAHSIGACHVAGVLMDHLEQNHRTSKSTERRDLLPAPGFPKSERILIRLGALLHDISHGPFSHDLERKKHELHVLEEGKLEFTPIKVKSARDGTYEKHDDYEHNPALYVLLFDEDSSTLARLLAKYSCIYWTLLKEETTPGNGRFHDTRPFKDLAAFVAQAKASNWEHEDTTFANKLLPRLLFHLLVFEKPSSSHGERVSRAFDPSTGEAADVTDWHLGPTGYAKQLHDAWYRPYRHDIIGNTLSADLLDYLQRDCNRLGLKRAPDEYMLHFYVLATESKTSLRTALDVTDHKRGVVRGGLVSDIFRLLELRHEIHERAVAHRVVQATCAMLTRALSFFERSGSSQLRLTDASDSGSMSEMVRAKPSTKDLYFPSDDRNALSGDDVFLDTLIRNGAVRAKSNHVIEEATNLLKKIAQRRFYRPLMMVPGLEQCLKALPLVDIAAAGPDDIAGAARRTEAKARRLAVIVACARYAPFFMFVSVCIEQFLLGVFEKDALIERVLQLQRADRPSVGAVWQNPTSRVIPWAMPYKQLYKDPEIAVLVGSRRFVLNKIPLRTQDEDSKLQALRDRVDPAIRHADASYAGMWNTYVFISDGLFYSGMIRKCTGGGGQHGNADHEGRLQEAVVLIAAALRVAFTDCLETERKLPEIGYGEAPSILGKECTDQELRDLTSKVMQVWSGAAVGTELRKKLERMSAVDVKAYVHDDPSLKHDDPSLKHSEAMSVCRDIVYKTDGQVNLITEAPARAFADAQAKRIASELKKVKGLEEINESEWRDLVARFSRRNAATFLESMESAATAVSKAKAARVIPEEARARELLQYCLMNPLLELREGDRG